jgi:4-hydroxy-2-oxoheptanedioate aldolase
LPHGWAYFGGQEQPEVRAAVEHWPCRRDDGGQTRRVNAFNPATAKRYLTAEGAFVLVDADVALLARGSKALAAEHINPADGDAPTGY